MISVFSVDSVFKTFVFRLPFSVFSVMSFVITLDIQKAHQLNPFIKKSMRNYMSKRSFTVNLNEEIIAKINKLAKANKLNTSELVSWVLLNFVSNYDILNDKTKTSQIAESDDEKDVEDYESLRKNLSTGDIPKESKEFLIG